VLNVSKKYLIIVFIAISAGRNKSKSRESRASTNAGQTVIMGTVEGFLASLVKGRGTTAVVGGFRFGEI